MFRNVSKPILKTEIEAVELGLGIKFPDNFIEHYLSYNGGIPDKPFFYSKEMDIETEIQVFSPIKYRLEGSEIKTVEEKYIYFKRKSALMSEYLPFANDYGSNQICINLTNKKIYIVYMDIGELEQKCFKFLASGFDEFINGLSGESIDA